MDSTEALQSELVQEESLASVEPVEPVEPVPQNPKKSEAEDFDYGASGFNQCLGAWKMEQLG